MNDTILCRDRNDAKETGDTIGWSHIDNWEFLEGGEVRLILNCKVEDIK